MTGGNRGLGRHVAEALAAEGATVAVLSRSGGTIDGALGLRADVTDLDAVRSAFARVERELGSVDILVNNAGTAAAIGPVSDVDPELWWSDVSVSLRGAFHCCRAVLPAMLERRQGRIVNVSSSVAIRASPYLSGYAAAKAALLSFTESIAAEGSARGVRVFAVTPGRVATELTERMVSTDEGRRWLPGLQQGDWVDPALGARLVVFLASGRGDALSGRFLHALDDVDELAAKAEEIVRDDLYVSRLRT